MLVRFTRASGISRFRRAATVVLVAATVLVGSWAPLPVGLSIWLATLMFGAFWWRESQRLSSLNGRELRIENHSVSYGSRLPDGSLECEWQVSRGASVEVDHDRLRVRLVQGERIYDVSSDGAEMPFDDLVAAIRSELMIGQGGPRAVSRPTKVTDDGAEV